LIGNNRNYERADSLVLREIDQLRALADPLRTRILTLLQNGAASTSELATALGLAHGTVAHHVKVLEAASLVRVVSTRKVRAMTEKYYGRVARLFVISTEGFLPSDLVGEARGFAIASLQQAAEEIGDAWAGPATEFGIAHVRLGETDAIRFARRLNRLFRDFRERESEDGVTYTLIGGVYPTKRPNDGRRDQQ
jgi:DNA-binding transcriptional ArsR family regulator